MTNNNGKKTANNNTFTWTAAQQQLLNLAMQGDEDACGKLYCSMAQYLESVFRYSQDGTNPKKFGYGVNFYGRTYESASGDVYMAFRKGVLNFKPSLGVPFGAYITNELRHRSMDWARNRKNDRLVLVGQCAKSEEGVIEVLGEHECEDVFNSYYNEKSQDLCDSETHPVEYTEMMDLMQKVRKAVAESKNEKLVRFVNTYLECADMPKVMEEVADRMGVTRAMAYNYMKQVREIVFAKMGDEFGENYSAAA